MTEEQLRELYGGADAGDIPEELLRQFAEEDNNDDDVDEDEEEDEDGEEGEEGQEEEVQPQGSTTSARLRMHHEMVQQMRARAGFAPEPFPGDVVPGEEGAAAGEEGEDAEDYGGVGSSQGATAHRIKKVGKKKAEKLQRKEQMRAYHEVTSYAFLSLAYFSSSIPKQLLNPFTLVHIQTQYNSSWRCKGRNVANRKKCSGSTRPQHKKNDNGNEPLRSKRTGNVKNNSRKRKPRRMIPGGNVSRPRRSKMRPLVVNFVLISR